MSDVLILNSDARPISFLPLSASTETWQDAMIRLYKGEAEVLHEYPNWAVHSPSITIQVPSVIILKKQVKRIRAWIARDNCAQRDLVFLRDLFICQYCNEQFSKKSLTLDHVTPRYHGGRTTWLNVTTACTTCNCKRGHDVKIQPRVKPYRPTFDDLVKNMRKFPITIPDLSWNWYLGWDEDKVKVVDPKKNRIYNEIFESGIQN